MHTTYPKPAKGSGFLARKERRRQIMQHEETEKRAVRLRDKTCRWPACEYAPLKPRLEAAHLKDKSLGGENSRRNMVTLCAIHHQGAVSLHSKDLRIEPMTDRGAEGPLAFYRQMESGRWECLAVERAVGVSEARRP